MKTLLDLIQEWAVLNEARTLAGGVLPPDDEARWSEPREFYELLMAQDGLSAHPIARYSAAEIRKAVTTRSRLRVRTHLEIVVMKEPEVHRARVGNMSCGGVLLLSDSGFGLGAGVVLHLTNLSRGGEAIPTNGAIMWSADSGSGNGTFRYRMGVQFAGLGAKEEGRLDAYIVDSLETKLLSVARDSLPADFVAREHLAL